MLIARVNFEFLKDLPVQPILRQHAFDSSLNHTLWMGRQQLSGRAGTKSTRVTAIGMILFLVQFITGQFDFSVLITTT